MGNAIKRQLLTAAVSTAFVLASVGVASAGVMTTLNGTIKAKELCASATGMTNQTVDGVQDKLKDDLVVVWDFSGFPDIDAIVTTPTLGFVYTMDGIAIRQNDKKGTFILEGTDATVAPDFNQLEMAGSYKNDKDAIAAVPPENVPTNIKGDWVLQTLTTGNFADLAAIACNAGGSFKAKGDGTQAP